MRSLALAAVALLVFGCGTIATPTPTQAPMDDVIAGLVLRRVTIHHLTSGDAGCLGSGLHSNAVKMEVSLDDRSTTHQIYLLRWRRSTDFTASAQAFTDCVAEYQALHPGQDVRQVESEPWRAYGSGWPPDLAGRLLDALRAAGGGG